MVRKKYSAFTLLPSDRRSNISEPGTLRPRSYFEIACALIPDFFTEITQIEPGSMPRHLQAGFPMSFFMVDGSFHLINGLLNTKNYIFCKPHF